MYDVDEHGCWNWTGPFYKNGNPKYHLPETNRPTNAMLYYLRESGVVLVSNSIVRSHCKNKQCVNPEHHYKGDNTSTRQRGDRPVRIKAGSLDREIIEMHQSGYGHGAIVEKFHIEQDEVFMALFREGLIFQDMHETERKFILS